MRTKVIVVVILASLCCATLLLLLRRVSPDGFDKAQNALPPTTKRVLDIRVAFITLAAGVAYIAYWTTFRYVYFSNDDTRVHGWPVPIVVFHRADSDSPWLDYVGFTTLLGYPMNFVVFMAAPSLLLFALVWRRRRSGSNRLAL